MFVFVLILYKVWKLTVIHTHTHFHIHDIGEYIHTHVHTHRMFVRPYALLILTCAQYFIFSRMLTFCLGNRQLYITLSACHASEKDVCFKRWSFDEYSVVVRLSRVYSDFSVALGPTHSANIIFFRFFVRQCYYCVLNSAHEP